MFQIGDIRLHIINDAISYVDPGGAFGLVPRALWRRYIAPDADDLIPMFQVNLLIETAGRRVLVDTGFGSKLDDKMQRIWRLQRPDGDNLAALARLGLRPDDIDLVINTHLHADHCAGNTRYDASGVLVAAFPNAEYVVQRREYEDAMRPNERTAATYQPINYEPLHASGQLRLLEGDATPDGTELAPGVWGVITRGHTPAHMSVRISDGSQHALFTCDMATYAVHFERLGWMTAYDVEPLYTLEAKRYWQAWALETDALLIFPHDPLRPVGRLTENAHGHRTVIPVVIPFA